MPEIKKVLVVGAGGELPCVALGEDIGVELVEAERRKPESMDEKIAFLQEQMANAISMLDNLFLMVKELREKVDKDKDKAVTEVVKAKKSDSVLPEGTVLHGTTQGLSFFLQIRDGGFWVNNIKYDSLSAAAEGVSGVRRSGWTFWKFPDGKSVKEILRG